MADKKTIKPKAPKEVPLKINASFEEVIKIIAKVDQKKSK